MGPVAPSAPEDAPMVAKMATIGIVPGKPFDFTKLDPAVQRGEVFLTPGIYLTTKQSLAILPLRHGD